MVTIVSLLLYGRAVGTLGASAGAAFGALGPALSALLAIPLLGEWPTTADWIAIMLVSFGVFLLVTQDVLDQAPGGGVLVADPLDYLAVALDYRALGNQVGFDHCLQV